MTCQNVCCEKRSIEGIETSFLMADLSDFRVTQGGSNENTWNNSMKLLSSAALLSLCSQHCLVTSDTFIQYRGDCGSEVERSSTNRKIGGSIPGSSNPHVDVSLGKTLNPKLLPMAAPSVYECVWMLAPSDEQGRLVWQSLSSVYECVWMRWMTCSVQRFEWSERLERRYISAVHLPFTILFYLTCIVFRFRTP